MPIRNASRSERIVSGGGDRVSSSQRFFLADRSHLARIRLPPPSRMPHPNRQAAGLRGMARLRPAPRALGTRFATRLGTGGNRGSAGVGMLARGAAKRPIGAHGSVSVARAELTKRANVPHRRPRRKRKLLANPRRSLRTACFRTPPLSCSPGTAATCPGPRSCQLHDNAGSSRTRPRGRWRPRRSIP